MSFKEFISQQQNIHLSTSQAHAVNKIDEFLNSPVYQTFIFKGAAGSGKTKKKFIDLNFHGLHSDSVLEVVRRLLPAMTLPSGAAMDTDEDHDEL